MNDVKALPSDVWFDILRRIPAAHLFRLKAVCKTFKVLISDALFVQQNLNHFAKHTKPIIISTEPPEIPYQKTYDPDKRTISVWYDEPRLDAWCSFHDYSGPRTKHHHRVIDSYNGILLIQICNKPLLCNPITRSYKLLPSSGGNSWNLGFSKLAYDDVSKHYKVFGLRRKGIDRVLLCVFDVQESHCNCETTAVKLSENSHISVVDIVKEGVLVNGNVYWLVNTYTDANDPETWIVSVNVTTEEVKTRSCSSMPFDLNEMGINIVFVANGTFYQFGRSYYHRKPLLWVLEGIEDENPSPSWMIKHRFDTQRVINSTFTCVIGMFRDKILMIIRGGYDSDQLYQQYDISSEKLEEVTEAIDGNIRHEMNYSVTFRIVEHVDSLISL